MWQHVHEDAALREIRKQTKKPSREERVRQKGWTDIFAEDPDGYDDLDITDRERVMPKGETEWRQAKVIRSPLHEGFGLAEPAPAGNRTTGWTQAEGTVVEISSGLCSVQAGGQTYLCHLRSALRVPHSGYSNMVAVGDRVTISHNGNGGGHHDGGRHDGMVEAIQPRRSALARPDPFNVYKQQVIVANVDQVLIVAAWREPAFWPELMDRYLIAAQRHNLTPVIVINKIDLAAGFASEDAEFASEDANSATEMLYSTAAAYRAAGHRVILTSAISGCGLDELRGVLAGKTTALAGLSGVGKSSLLRAVEPGLNLRVSEVSERKHEGRHTTTQVTLHPLAAGGFVADTPGIREFGLAGLKPAELPRFYDEFAAAGPCEFANCSHTREPGCAVKAAVRRRRISAMRYESYVKIRRDLA